MTRDDAADLFRLLSANYPRTKITEETTRLWIDTLVQLEHRTGQQAVGWARRSG
jgi:hypothetical protein